MSKREAGSVSAEFAVALPAAVVIAGVLMTGVRLAADHAWLASASASVARSIAVGIPSGDALAQIIGDRSGVTSRLDVTNETVCVELSQRPGGLMSVAPIEAREKSCARRAL